MWANRANNKVLELLKDDAVSHDHWSYFAARAVAAIVWALLDIAAAVREK
jgi:hypothetical protein